MRLLLEPDDDGRVAEAVAAYRDDYDRNGKFACAAYSGVPQALAKQAGARLYVATSKRTRFAVPILDHLNLSEFFNGTYGSEEGGALDHKPELIASGIERHSLAQDRCVMVGDRRHDVVGAHANGVRALGLLWGYGTRDELEAAGADDLVSEPAALPAAALALVMPAEVIATRQK